MKITNKAGADPESFERGGPEAIIYKILERGGPKSVKMAFECLFQSFSYKYCTKRGGGGRPPGPLPYIRHCKGSNYRDSTAFTFCGEV